VSISITRHHGTILNNPTLPRRPSLTLPKPPSQTLPRRPSLTLPKPPSLSKISYTDDQSGAASSKAKTTECSQPQTQSSDRTLYRRPSEKQGSIPETKKQKYSLIGVTGFAIGGVAGGIAGAVSAVPRDVTRILKGKTPKSLPVHTVNGAKTGAKFFGKIDNLILHPQKTSTAFCSRVKSAMGFQTKREQAAVQADTDPELSHSRSYGSTTPPPTQTAVKTDTSPSSKATGISSDQPKPLKTRKVVKSTSKESSVVSLSAESKRVKNNGNPQKSRPNLPLDQLTQKLKSFTIDPPSDVETSSHSSSSASAYILLENSVSSLSTISESTYVTLSSDSSTGSSSYETAHSSMSSISSIGFEASWYDDSSSSYETAYSSTP